MVEVLVILFSKLALFRKTKGKVSKSAILAFVQGSKSTTLKDAVIFFRECLK
jgi:hypothetical protein